MVASLQIVDITSFVVLAILSFSKIAPDTPRELPPVGAV
jgi:hypothetical protein